MIATGREINLFNFQKAASRGRETMAYIKARTFLIKRCSLLLKLTIVVQDTMSSGKLFQISTTRLDNANLPTLIKLFLNNLPLWPRK